MEIVPVFCEHLPGELFRIVVTSLLAEGEEKGAVWRNFSIGVPTEENWGEEAWMDRVVHIPEYNGYSVAIGVRDFSRSDVQAFGLADLLELLELQSFT